MLFFAKCVILLAFTHMWEASLAICSQWTRVAHLLRKPGADCVYMQITNVTWGWIHLVMDVSLNVSCHSTILEVFG